MIHTKANAHSKLKYAIKTGKTKRPDDCSKCYKKCKPEGHHPDYDKPLEVIWLCKKCHCELHPYLSDKFIKLAKQCFAQQLKKR